MIAETSVWGGMLYLHGTHMRALELSYYMYKDRMDFRERLGISQDTISLDKARVWGFLLTITFMVVGGTDYVRRMCANARRR